MRGLGSGLGLERPKKPNRFNSEEWWQDFLEKDLFFRVSGKLWWIGFDSSLNDRVLCQEVALPQSIRAHQFGVPGLFPPLEIMYSNFRLST